MIPRLLPSFYARLPLSEKFKRDAVWNIASTMFCGLAGLTIILIISKRYGPEILGLFNLTFAIFSFLSQLAVGGVHFSVLKYAAQYAADDPEIRTIMTTGLVSTILTSLVIGALALVFRGSIAALFHKPELDYALLCVIPGLLFFSLNKVFFSFHNARRRMRSYAVLQALRFVLFAAALIIFVALSFDGVKIPAIFSISEFLLFIIVLVYSHKHVRLGLTSIKLSWLRDHFCHGFKAAIGNIFAEINTRTDIIVLGLFSTSKIIGIYSFPATLVDGFNQISFVFRANVNPILAGHKHKKSEEELGSLIEKGRNLFYKYMIPAGILGLLIFPLIIAFFSLNREFYKGMIPFVLLMAGSLASAGYRPFLMIPNQTGFPGYQSLLYFLIFLTNVAGNVLFVSLFGMIGAALGTSLSFISAVFYLKWIVRKTIGLKI
jgi:O-antigen/teichoic acid export membrane protein